MPVDDRWTHVHGRRVQTQHRMVPICVLQNCSLHTIRHGPNTSAMPQQARFGATPKRGLRPPSASRRCARCQRFGTDTCSVRFSNTRVPNRRVAKHRLDDVERLPAVGFGNGCSVSRDVNLSPLTRHGLLPLVRAFAIASRSLIHAGPARAPPLAAPGRRRPRRARWNAAPELSLSLTRAPSAPRAARRG